MRRIWRLKCRGAPPSWRHELLGRFQGNQVKSIKSQCGSCELQR